MQYASDDIDDIGPGTHTYGILISWNSADNHVILGIRHPCDGDATGWAVVVSRTVTWLECGDWDCAVCTTVIRP
jgi:hypothetical protein